MDSVRVIEDWPVEQAAGAVVASSGQVLGDHGPVDQVFPLASVTKLLTAYATLIAVEEGAVEWDQPAGPPDATVRHLIAHASGLAFNEHKVVAPPGNRRLYSNAGFEVLADTVQAACGIPFAEYLADAVLRPLGMTRTRLDGSPAADGESTVDDLVRFAAELQSPKLIDPATGQEATTVAFPGLAGVLPGLGYQQHNDWGLGFELRDHKDPHWTGEGNSPRTYGHFGRSGTFLWVDPDAGVAAVVLTDRIFGDWAKKAWPAFADGVLAELAG
ncbi:MAG TPA: serine hydrolase domain-containing protein [Pseudonocardiaceae bacterium]|nr:serine hydrolase domain-containing protein [Pseudonocardiaceae bacterium]